MTLNEREAFEALPDIKEKLNAVYFDESLNSYFAAMINSGPTVKYVQGAWMAWQAKAQAVPEGYVVVPKVPTEKMANAFDIGMLESENFFGDLEAFQDAYKAMLEASESGAGG